MNWKIKIEVWKNQDQNNALKQLLETICSEFDELIPSGPVTGFKPLNLFNDPIAGPTIYWPLNDEFYKIGLNIKEGDYAKASFQFAHQLCHIYIDPRVNNWFVESVCNLTGYYFLERFANNPAFDKLISHFPNDSLSFEDYYSKKIKFNYSDIDLVQHQHSSNWIKREVKKLQKTREWSDITIKNMIAFELLPYFRDNKENWELLQIFGKSTKPSPPQDAANLSSSNMSCPDFDKFFSLVPENLKPVANEMVSRILE
ncbi:MAG: hypothetical protein U9R19_09550 [Bacteroidota bacterium]|nr:hypothetical protein [Bacteroidota bacterium]